MQKSVTTASFSVGTVSLWQYAQNSERAQAYVNILIDLWPLALIGATLSLFVGMRYVKRSYLQRTFLQTLGNLLWSAGITMALVVGSVTLLQWVEPDIPPAVDVGVAICVGLFGLKGVDLFMRRKFGLKITDLMDADALSEELNKLTDEQKQIHLKQCPLRNHCKEKGAEK